MKDYTFTDRGFTFKRVDKKKARAAFNNGLRVLFCPCNLRPGYPYHPETDVSGRCGASFETMLNSFEYYNIRNRETGYYTAFYIPVVEVDSFTGKKPTEKTINTVLSYDYSYLGGETV